MPRLLSVSVSDLPELRRTAARDGADEGARSRVAARYGVWCFCCLTRWGTSRSTLVAELLFQIITEREERASIAIATMDYAPPYKSSGRTVPEGREQNDHNS